VFLEELKVPRPSQISERRRQLLPIVTQAFAELGYRRTTTAELSKRCQVQENILYRLWTDKKAMFVATIEYIYETAEASWKDLLAADSSRQSAAERLLEYEAKHYGEDGLYRIVFAGLSELDDPQVSAAMSRMYKRYWDFIRKQISVHRGQRTPELPEAELAAWALVGLGTVANIGQELGLISSRRRKKLIAQIGKTLLDGALK